jgi:hypothetical protein
MTTVIFDGKYLAADDRSTNADTGEKTDGVDKLFYLGDKNVKCGTDANRNVIAVAGAGLLADLKRFVNFLCQIRDLEKTIALTANQFSKPSSNMLIMFSSGEVGRLYWKSNGISGMQMYTLNYYLIRTGAVGSGNTVAEFGLDHLSKNLGVTAMELVEIAAGFDSHTGKGVRFVSADSKGIEYKKPMTLKRRKEISKFFNNALIPNKVKETS